MASEGFIDLLASTKAADVTVLFKEADPTETRVSVRTSARADAVAITSAFGGGGHARAAGCSVERPARRGDAPSCWRNASASSTAPMLGVVNLDKPVGPTSHDMVGLMRRLTGTRRIGHAGHARPARVRRPADPRRRRHAVQRGADRAAASGTTPSSASAQRSRHRRRRGPDRRRRRAAAVGRGPSPMRWPASSARSTSGRRRSAPARSRGRTAYRAARAGEPIDLPPRTVTVDSIELLDVEPRATAGWTSASTCAAAPGTYVRSIARDLGERLGCGGAPARPASHRGGRPAARTTRSRPSGSRRSPARAGLARRCGRLASCCRCRRSRWTRDAAWRFVHGATQPHGDRRIRPGRRSSTRRAS